MRKKYPFQVLVFCVVIFILGTIFGLVVSMEFFDFRALDLFKNGQSNGNQTEEPNNNEEPTEGDAARTEVGFEKLEESSDNYTIDISYPILDSTNTELKNDFNFKVLELYTSAANALKDQANTDAENGELFVGPYSLDIDSEVSLINPSIISFSSDGYIYTGGAHGLSAFYNLNYDINKLDFIELKELFKNQDYLSFLSETSRDQLREMKWFDADTSEEWVLEGTEASEDNFSIYYLTEDSLVLVMSEYQVAPYAVGMSSVTIPYAELSELLKEEYANVLL